MMRKLAAFSFCTLVALSGAQAANITLKATSHPTKLSTFTLDFGDLGGQRSANITSTNFDLVLNPLAGEAAITNYYQEVDPIELPGGFSTGNITVTILPGSSAGTLNARYGIFETEEFYQIDFEGDLSAFGLTSPVFLPGSSSGRIFADRKNGKAIEMEWNGIGQLDNPGDPANPLVFNYKCDVKTVYTGPSRLLP